MYTMLFYDKHLVLLPPPASVALSHSLLRQSEITSSPLQYISFHLFPHSTPYTKLIIHKIHLVPVKFLSPRLILLIFTCKPYFVNINR